MQSVIGIFAVIVIALYAVIFAWGWEAHKAQEAVVAGCEAQGARATVFVGGEMGCVREVK